MARHMGDGVALAQVLAKLAQTCVLCVFEDIALQAFQFNADRIVIALGTTSVLGLSGMPRPVVGADKLPQAAVTPDVKVRGDLQAPDLCEIRMRIPVQLVGEQRLHFLATVLTGWQADGVDDQQIDASASGSGAKVGRIQPLGVRVPALIPKADGFIGVFRHGGARTLGWRCEPSVFGRFSGLGARLACLGFSHRIAVLCGCAVFGAAVKAFFTRDGFFLRQVDAAMWARHHVGGGGKGRWLFGGV